MGNDSRVAMLSGVNAGPVGGPQHWGFRGVLRPVVGSSTVVYQPVDVVCELVKGLAPV